MQEIKTKNNFKTQDYKTHVQSDDVITCHRASGELRCTQAKAREWERKHTFHVIMKTVLTSKTAQRGLRKPQMFPDCSLSASDLVQCLHFVVEDIEAWEGK